MYPSTEKAPGGKLRLVYECNPMAFIAEQAGGRATNGTVRIMDIKPTELHQRVPFAVGSENLMDQLQTHLTAWGQRFFKSHGLYSLRFTVIVGRAKPKPKTKVQSHRWLSEVEAKV